MQCIQQYDHHVILVRLNSQFSLLRERDMKTEKERNRIYML